jgi:hypothetical protein
MNKPKYSKLLAIMPFLALALMLLPVHIYVGPTPGDSSTSSIWNAAKTTVQLGWTEAQAKKPDHCVGHCKAEYKERLAECKNKNHEHHKDCKKWAKARQRECLKDCRREHP